MVDESKSKPESGKDRPSPQSEGSRHNADLNFVFKEKRKKKDIIWYGIVTHTSGTVYDLVNRSSSGKTQNP